MPTTLLSRAWGKEYAGEQRLLVGIWSFKPSFILSRIRGFIVPSVYFNQVRMDYTLFRRYRHSES